MKDLTRVIAALGLALISGCATTPPSDLPETTRAVMDKEGVQRVEVVAGSYWFRPDHIIVKTNAPVLLVVRKQSTVVPHTFVLHAPEAGISIDMSLSSEPKSVTFTPTRPGTYEYYCSESGLFGNHRAKGMEGVLEVTK